MATYRQRDRLSALPDEALERILSHLSSDEATRATALSRRWRRICEGVPVVDLVDRETDRDRLPVCFDSKVTGAILSKGPDTPIRVLRLHARHPPDDLLDGWIVTAASSGAEEIDIALQYRHYPRRTLCPFGTASAGFGEAVVRDSCTRTPRQIFRCATLRRLRLANWTLCLKRIMAPAAVLQQLVSSCPHLVDLTLEECPTATKITVSSDRLRSFGMVMAPAAVLQQLVSSCPHLVDLTLEECPTATKITVSSDRLRSFGMVCCHNARRVVLRTRRLRSLRYKGGLPSGTILDIPDYDEVAALTIDICEDLTSKAPMEVAPVLELISRCKKLTYLHLALRPSMAYYSSEITGIARDHLPELRHLVLKGFLAADHVVRAVAVLVASTLTLEALSLFPLGSEPSKKTYHNYYDDEYGGDSDSDPEPEICDDGDHILYDDDWMLRSMWRWGIPCSRHSLKRINITKYCGSRFDRILANFLLSNGAALEEFSGTLPAPLWPRREEITMMFRSWRHNPRTIVTCS